MSHLTAKQPFLVVGSGIGGIATALALANRGFNVKVLEQAATLGEIGAGIQLGPNAFNALDALGLGDLARGQAVYTDEVMLRDAIDQTSVARVLTNKHFIERFGNPYAVMHRADLLGLLLERASKTGGIEIQTATKICRVDQNGKRVTAIDSSGNEHHGIALIAADGIKSAVRSQYVGDDARVSGHVVYRAVIDKADFPSELQWNSVCIWVAPHSHLVQYPLSGGERFNVVVTFQSQEKEELGVRQGSREEVDRYFENICDNARQLIELPKDWTRWATADREPIAHWVFGSIALLGDAAHPTLQYLAQGACMALEDAVTLGESMRVHDNNIEHAFDAYQRARIVRTARIVYSSREMGRIFHAQGVERLVRNQMWTNHTPKRFYDALDWLYAWNITNCLSS